MKLAPTGPLSGIISPHTFNGGTLAIPAMHTIPTTGLHRPLPETPLHTHTHNTHYLPTGKPKTCFLVCRAKVNFLVSWLTFFFLISLKGIFSMGFNAIGPFSGLGGGGPHFAKRLCLLSRLVQQARAKVTPSAPTMATIRPAYPPSAWRKRGYGEGGKFSIILYSQLQ